MSEHCCFCTDENNFVPTVRIHVPLAKICTMGCIYCSYELDSNLSSSFERPGVSNFVVTKNIDISEYVKKYMSKYPNTHVIGVSGPGEALDNFEQLKFLYDYLQLAYPDVVLCVCSNGKKYKEFKKELLSWNSLKYFTITINSFNPSSVIKIYRSVNSYKEALNLIETQKTAIKELSMAEKKVKINIVYMPGINDLEIESLCQQVTLLGADCINLLPVIASKQFVVPQGDIIYEKVHMVKRDLISKGYKITHKCRRCRADFCGY